MQQLWSEAHKFQRWLEVEIAVCAAWESLGEIPAGVSARLKKHFREPLQRGVVNQKFIDRIAAFEQQTQHDVVAFTRAITESLEKSSQPQDAKYIHLGLTSTDIVDTAQNLLLCEALELIGSDLADLQQACLRIAAAHKHSLCIGRSHGIHAEPMSFGLKFLNFYAALQRDAERLEAAKNNLSVAMLSGSIGSYSHAQPQLEEHVARQLGLRPDPISNQTVARDRHAELLSALAILGTSIERIALEIRHLQRSEVREVFEGFAAKQTGSSSMPHKKNPIASENLCGLARLLRSNLQAGLENVALWHERDISHSSVERVILPDSTTLASYALQRMRRVLENLVIDPEAMQHNLGQLRGLIYSQRVLHLLIAKGMMREEAYNLVQHHSLRVWESSELNLEDALAQDPALPLSRSELAQAFDPVWYLRHNDAIFARFGL